MADTIVCLSPILVLVAIAVVVLIVTTNQARVQDRKVKAAWEKYWYALEELRESPDSSQEREATLHAGREFARLVREGGSETVFDEVALMNDINAIAGQQVFARSTERGQRADDLSIEERLVRLRKLAEAGQVTKEEYLERRKRVLDQL
jgi:hypothetical protein